MNADMKGKMLIVSAPSGSGKSTIVNWLMQEHPELKLYFSISCTSRAPRGTAQNGVVLRGGQLCDLVERALILR